MIPSLFPRSPLPSLCVELILARNTQYPVPLNTTVLTLACVCRVDSTTIDESEAIYAPLINNKLCVLVEVVVVDGVFPIRCKTIPPGFDGAIITVAGGRVCVSSRSCGSIVFSTIVVKKDSFVKKYRARLDNIPPDITPRTRIPCENETTASCNEAFVCKMIPIKNRIQFKLVYSLRARE